MSHTSKTFLMHRGTSSQDELGATETTSPEFISLLMPEALAARGPGAAPVIVTLWARRQPILKPPLGRVPQVRVSLWLREGFAPGGSRCGRRMFSPHAAISSNRSMGSEFSDCALLFLSALLFDGVGQFGRGVGYLPKPVNPSMDGRAGLSAGRPRTCWKDVVQMART
jgi:hypothetical protein